MVWTIARKEIHENLISLRFILLLAPVDLKALPEFRLPAAGVVETVPALDLAILPLWFAGAGALVYRGLARYDVR